jgi:hypothetical protein
MQTCGEIEVLGAHRSSAIQEQDLAAAVTSLVGSLRQDGGILNTGAAARKIYSSFPQCGSAPSQIAEMLARRAIAAGIPVQFTPAE